MTAHPPSKNVYGRGSKFQMIQLNKHKKHAQVRDLGQDIVDVLDSADPEYLDVIEAREYAQEHGFL